VLPFASRCGCWVASEVGGMALLFAAGAGERVTGDEFFLDALGFRVSAWSSHLVGCSHVCASGSRRTCELSCGVLGLCAAAGADVHWGLGGMWAMGRG
jgi:hypothetical protein